jgi:hypothetical protein
MLADEHSMDSIGPVPILPWIFRYYAPVSRLLPFPHKETKHMADAFRLTKALTGITFNHEGRGSLSTLAIDSRLIITGPSKLPGFIEVTCGVALYSIFRVDLIERSVTVRTMAAAA